MQIYLLTSYNMEKTVLILNDTIFSFYGYRYFWWCSLKCRNGSFHFNNCLCLSSTSKSKYKDIEFVHRDHKTGKSQCVTINKHREIRPKENLSKTKINIRGTYTLLLRFFYKVFRVQLKYFIENDSYCCVYQNILSSVV